MSRKKSRDPALQHVLVCVSDDKFGPLITCGRKEGAEDDRLVFFMGPVDDESKRVQTGWTLDEIEPFLEQAASLVDDARRLPICGRHEIRAKRRKLSVEVVEPDDEIAIVRMTCEAKTGPDLEADAAIDRAALHRFLIGCLETICNDMEDED
jgi:hypothetical protein